MKVLNGATELSPTDLTDLAGEARGTRAAEVADVVSA